MFCAKHLLPVSPEGNLQAFCPENEVAIQFVHLDHSTEPKNVQSYTFHASRTQPVPLNSPHELRKHKFLQLIEAQSTSAIVIKDNKNEQIIKFAFDQYANFLSLKT